jgi:glycosyltransferase involved in cell wall biosynthesis
MTLPVADPPDVSVVVATRNRPGRLERLLDSLRAQTLDRDHFEVIVVDDASDDSTPSLLEREAERGDLDFRTLTRRSPGGPARARDEGWRAARGSLVAFTDDDCTVDPGWLAAGVAAASLRPGAVVQGRTDPDPAERDRLGPFSRTVEVHDLGPYYQTCNIFYPRELLERVGGFDSDAFRGPGGEDTDLAWRAIAAGAETVFAPEAQAYHAVAHLGPLGRLRVAARWGDTIGIFARHRALRAEHLTYGVFWKGTHYLLFRFAVALALRRWLPLVLVVWLGAPYIRNLLERGQLEGGGPVAAPYYVVEDVVEMVSVVRGAIRSRTVVI